MAVPQPRFARLPDGRTLAYNEFGDPTGFPIVYNHHWLGSRLDAVPIAEAAEDARVKLICPDRPGFGASAPHRDRTLIGWAADVHALTRSLGVGTYSVLGWAGGGPSTIACAFALGQYVKRVGIVSGFGPVFMPELTATLPGPDRSAIRMARRGAWARRLALALRRRRMKGPRETLGLLASPSPSDERLLSDRTDIAAGLASSSEQAFRQGVEGPSIDLDLMLRPWGFELTHISTPVMMWHGADDDTVGVENALAYQRLLLNPRLKLFDGLGHLLFFTHAAEVLDSLRTGAPITPT